MTWIVLGILSFALASSAAASAAAIGHSYVAAFWAFLAGASMMAIASFIEEYSSKPASNRR